MFRARKGKQNQSLLLFLLLLQPLPSAEKKVSTSLVEVREESEEKENGF